jgi:hypothetical protein
MSWLPLAAALAAFGASHYLPGATGLREALVARLGQRVYFAGFKGLAP